MFLDESLLPYINKVHHADCREFLPKLSSESIDAVITDPPYFLDKLDNNWTPEQAKPKVYSSQQVQHLPPGMKFDPQQSKRLYEWYLPICKDIFRVLKPGGFFFTFASPRLFHRVACAVEDAGFWIRDTFLWLYTQSQPKAMGLEHFIKKMNISDNEKQKLIDKIKDWKTPQVKSVYEPIIVAQKPAKETLLKNFITYNVGLFNTRVKIGENMFPSNILIVEETETILDKYFMVSKVRGNRPHPTMKPIELCSYLIELSTVEGAVILDPFAGSGTTLVAAKVSKRNYIGIEISKEYIKIMKNTLHE